MKNIETFVSAKEYSLVAEILSEIEPKEASSILFSLSEEDFLSVCREIEPRVLAEFLPYFNEEKLTALIDALNYTELGAVFSEIEPEQKVAVLKVLPAELAVRVLSPEDVGMLLHSLDLKYLKPLLD